MSYILLLIFFFFTSLLVNTARNAIPSSGDLRSALSSTAKLVRHLLLI